MAVTNSDTVILPDAAIPVSDFQKSYVRREPPIASESETSFSAWSFLNSGFIPVVGMAGKQTGSTDHALERQHGCRCGALISALSHRPSINIRKRPPNIWNQV